MPAVLFIIVMLISNAALAHSDEETSLVNTDMRLPERHLRVGVLANHGVMQGKLRWQPMMDYLSERVPGANFEVVPLGFEDMSQQMLNHDIQFMITNPGQYFNLSSNFPLSWLATMKSRKHQGTTFAIGATIIVRADSDIYTLNDLRGKSIVASGPQALGGYQAAVGLLHKMGYSPEQYFGDLRFLGFPLEPIVYQVRDKTVEAAITPFCTLEEMIDSGLVKKEDFRVIHPTLPKGYDCLVSTQLYPNWSFAAAETVPTQITRAITQALYDLEPDDEAAISAKTMGWTAPVSQLKVIKLFKELQLKTPPPPLYQTVLKWMERNKEWGGALLLLFLISTVYHLWLEYKFRQKSEFLIDTERQLQDKALQLERLQSTAILGEIGSGLAHELNQPIAAITQYSEGGMMHLNSLGQADAETYEVLAKINAQSLRAGAVVHRIRGLLKRRETSAEMINFDEVMNNSLVLFAAEFKRHGTRAEISTQGIPFTLKGDEVGLSQVIANIIKNSLDAFDGGDKDNSEPGNRISIRVSYRVDSVEVLLFDNGPGLQKSAHELMASFCSTKRDGLGLGLAICKDVISQHGGLFTIQNCSEIAKEQTLPWQQGCAVKIVLPKAIDH